MKTLRHITLALLLALLLSPPAACAAPGDVDSLNANIVGAYVYATAVQPDGKTIIAGAFSSVLGQPRNNIARLNADGTLDGSFNPNVNQVIYTVAVQADGKILLGGDFNTVGGTGRSYIARVAADGTLDASFNPDVYGTVSCLAVQADGQILLGGSFGSVGGTGRNYIARVAADGTLDAGFNPDAESAVSSVVVQADGKILLGGSFYTMGGTARIGIARVEADGTLDAGFNPDLNSSVYSVAVQADGKILLGGGFTTVGGTTRNYIARVDAAGMLDADFTPNVNGGVTIVAVQADGKILLGGDFTTVGGTGRNYIARVAANGSLDAGFNPDVTYDVNSVVYSVEMQADGKILLGGSFTAVSGMGRNYFARLLNDPATQTLSAVNTAQVLWTRGGSAPEVSQVTFELSTNGGSSYTPLGGTATRVGSTANWQLTGLSLPTSGQLRARGRTSSGYANSSYGLVEAVVSFSGLLPPAPTISGINPPIGSTAGGTSVTITGTNFTGATGVTIGGVAAENVVVVNATTITATTPAGSTGAASVQVTTPGGTNAANTLYNYLVLVHDIAVTQAGPLVDGVSGVAFGSTTMGSTSAPIIFTITNSGTVDLTSLAITKDGADADNFSVSGLSGTSIPAGTGSVTFSVTFSPTASGVKTAALHIANNVPGAKNPFDIALTGTGSTSLDASYTTGAEVPLTTAGFTAMGNTMGFALNYAPVPGTVLRVVSNTSLSFINGTFSNLAQGQVVPLSYNGETYKFVANYFGGTGNDLVLQWSSTAPMAWGANSAGQLGNSGSAQSNMPTAVNTAGVLASKTFLTMATGSSHSLVLCSDGTLAAWGANSAGQLGNNSTTSSNVPVAVNMAGLLAGKKVIAVAAGALHSLALCSDGTVAAWGDNSAGQLGNNSTTQSNVPVAVNTAGALAGRTVIAIAAGHAHSLALCSDGALVAWGDNSVGQLGNNDTTQSNVPVAVSTAGVLAGKTVITIAAGSTHNLAACADGTAVAWGDNVSGQLGNNSSIGSLVPVAVSTAVVLSGKSVVSVAAGTEHSLALCSDGTLAAWGWNGEGELGNNTLTNSHVPVAVLTTGTSSLLGKTVVAITAGSYHCLVLASDGTMAAWGINGNGEVGNNSTTTRRVPTTVNMSALPAGSRFMVGRSGSLSSHSLAIAATPADSPTAVTAAPTSITNSTATLAGTVNPNGRATDVYFQYGPTTAYGSTTAVQSLPTGTTAVDVTASIAGLTPNSTYHFQIVATNIGGTTFGLNGSFQTTASGIPNAAPSVTTGGTFNITTTSATLQGTVNPNGGITNAFFEYGIVPGFGSTTSNLGAGTGTTPQNIATGITALLPGTQYQFRLIAVNSLGTTTGTTATFTTGFLPPAATTTGSTPLSTTSVQVSGTVRAHNASTQVFFDYGTDGVSFPSTVAASPADITGDVDTNVTGNLPNLLQGTTYHYRVRAVSVGGTTMGAVLSFQVDVISGLLQQFPPAPPAATGTVTVTLNNGGSTSGWRFVGEQLWRNSGVTVTGMTTGDRAIEFRPVPGFIQPPQETVSIVAGQPAVLVERDYFDTPVTGSGGLSVTLKPDTITSGVDRAQWRLLGEDNTQWRDTGASLTTLPPGSHLIECKPVTGRTTPPVTSVNVVNGQTSAPTITYFLADSQTGTPPSVLPFSSVSTDTSRPYAYVGQIRSNAGASSGFVVKARVVATAGHVVFDDGTLSTAQGLQWLFQRDAGTYEPKPIIPRGFYLFDGYAAQRAAENSPGSSSPLSQHLDVAAMYFDEDAARGGFGGFLASDLASNEFILSSAQKTLVGYPVDGIPALEQGRMHATPLADVTFTSGYGRTFSTTSIRSVGGNSGGPLCIQYQGGAFYPAAVYLGGTGQTVVRALDSSVIDLFDRAAVSGGGGQNNTGGGITHTSITTIASASSGSLKVNLTPAGAVSGGAGWRISPETSYRISGGQKNGLSPGGYVLQFTSVAGYQAPAPQTITITSGQLATVTFNYAESVTPQESWRQTYFGTTSNIGDAADSFDYDGDGFTNAQEYAAGTNPMLSGDFFRVTDSQRTASTFTASTAGKAGRTYYLERSTNLTSWTNVTSQGPLASDGTVTLLDGARPADAAFYRIVVTGP